MLHIGRDEPGVPAPLIIFGWVIVLTAYCIVNHSQSMRLLAARSGVGPQDRRPDRQRSDRRGDVVQHHPGDSRESGHAGACGAG